MDGSVDVLGTATAALKQCVDGHDVMMGGWFVMLTSLMAATAAATRGRAWWRQQERVDKAHDAR